MVRLLSNRKHVLVVDDDPFIRTLLVAWLQEAGYVVLTAGDGQQALEQIRRKCPDLVLLDLMMPRLDGYEVVRFIRHQSDTCNLPIIVLSADVRAPQSLSGLRVDGFLSKPFDLDEMLARVNEYAPLDGLGAAV
ncbi:MAG: response regulator [Chloroflexota bacterium]